MRAAFVLALLPLVTACSTLVEPVPFTVLIDNPGQTVRYVEGAVPHVLLETRVDGDWLEVTESQASLCRPECGVPGSYQCLSSPAVYQPRAFALMPGESYPIEMDGDGWVIDPDRGCVRPVSHGGPISVEVCHAGAVEDPGGVAIDEPDTGGMLEGDAELVDAVCTDQQAEIVGDEEVALDVSEPE